MDALESPMGFSGRHLAEKLVAAAAGRLVPGSADLASDRERGREVHREIDRAVHLDPTSAHETCPGRTTAEWAGSS